MFNYYCFCGGEANFSLIAWLVFSGKKHQKFDADELIAIVYDGTYEVFQGLYHTVEVEADPREA